MSFGRPQPHAFAKAKQQIHKPAARAQTRPEQAEAEWDEDLRRLTNMTHMQAWSDGPQWPKPKSFYRKKRAKRK